MRTLMMAGLLAVATPLEDADACTRVVYKGLNGTLLTARSMDWKEDIQTNLWIFPRGMQRTGETGSNTVKWTSKYGSVIASGYDISTTDGMNEKGLVANLLFLAESQYPPFSAAKPGLSIAAWCQYLLDNFATVKECVDAMRAETFVIVTDKIPGMDRLANLHMSVSDPSGDNAIFQFINGKLDIHHSHDYNVMTNSPIFQKQLALNEYWQEIGGTVMLPGTNRSADRFVRASFYAQAIPKTDDTRLAVASVFSVIRNCSVPLGISTPGQPNISSTRWRSVSDHKNLVYYFETTRTPNTFWVDLKKVDFSPGSPVRKLPLTKDETYAGDAGRQFVKSGPFKFMGI
ncbi:linear amide C-N hydrolase [Chitinophaga caseinilytica]|uniref:linear amide C-N hydrolase n=1 Tax=Chitinophaga caseinilytica TaxID=2267521 RepID=UPI003C2E8AD2